MLKDKITSVVILTLVTYNLAYAIPPLCPAVEMIKGSQLTNNTHDDYGIWNLSTVGTFGTGQSWTSLVGNIKATDLAQAKTIAAKALSQINSVSGPFLAQNHWVCKYTPEPADGYYVVAWALNFNQY